ncbi:MAG: TRASH domain-containing protein [Candidatus Brocadiaceae bacterium]|nr:TRASH domain-containing protein [Candidatus Brocadiaceae bacterium]
MKRFGYFAVIAGISLVMATSYAGNKAFAGAGCCGAKEVSAAEKQGEQCLVCGKDIDIHGKPVKVEHKGKTMTFCCEKCAETFKKNQGECDREKKQN